MKYFLYIRLLLFSFYSTVQCIIESIDTLKSRNVGPYVYLYTDRHRDDLPELDEQELHALKHFLEIHACRGEIIHVCIEVTIPLTKANTALLTRDILKEEYFRTPLLCGNGFKWLK